MGGKCIVSQLKLQVFYLKKEVNIQSTVIQQLKMLYNTKPTNPTYKCNDGWCCIAHEKFNWVKEAVPSTKFVDVHSDVHFDQVLSLPSHFHHKFSCPEVPIVTLKSELSGKPNQKLNQYVDGIAFNKKM